MTTVLRKAGLVEAESSGLILCCKAALSDLQAHSAVSCGSVQEKLPQAVPAVSSDGLKASLCKSKLPQAHLAVSSESGSYL